MTGEVDGFIVHEQPTLPNLRIGDRVRSAVDDVNVSVGLQGLVVNVICKWGRITGAARVLWDNDTVSIADTGTFVNLKRLPAIPQPDAFGVAS